MFLIHYGGQLLPIKKSDTRVDDPALLKASTFIVELGPKDEVLKLKLVTFAPTVPLNISAAPLRL